MLERALVITCDAVVSLCAHIHHVRRYFPKIFGPKENEPLNKKASIDALEGLTTEVNTLQLL